MLTVCGSALDAWFGVCADLGIQPPETGISASEHNAGVIPLAGFVAMLEATASHYKEGPLGWIAGERFEFTQLGEIGKAILSSSTLGTALQRFVDYFALVQDAAEFDIRVCDDTVTVGYRILAPEIWPRQHDALFTLSIVGQLLRRAQSFDWTSVQLALEGNDPALTTAVRHRTGVACTDKADTNLIRFPASALALPMAHRDDVIRPDYKILNRDLAQKRRAMSVELRVETEVYRLLGADLPSQDLIASNLGMSTRTLRRRLAQANRSFQDIVYKCRMKQAAHEFRWRRSGSIAHTALRLGYSEHSALTRAFRRWSGVSPQTYLHA
ncbi:AraC family transcriptional regulator [Novosphingobium sp. Rr 2-17]|nr:AraC family transcriptional regulator [Novosphingobium sp. Rr 2-17]